MNKVLFSLAMILLLVYGCKPPEDDETQSGVDNALAEQAFMAVFPSVNVIANNDGRLNKTDSSTYSCADYTIDNAFFPAEPAVMVVDYGTGCMDRDGRYKAGKLVCTIYNKWSDDTARMSIHLVNYKMDQMNYQGQLDVTKYLDGVYDLKVTGGKCIDPVWTINYECQRTVEFIGGRATPVETDDVYRITGTAQGRNRKDIRFTSVIRSPILKSYSCKHVETGTMDVTPDDLSTRKVNFGDGKCENKATITVNDKTYDFEMR